MDKEPADEIIITALLKRFTEQRLPRVLSIEKRVQNGGTLNDSDLSFLEMVFNDAKYVFQYSDKYPEYREVIAKCIQLYEDIVKKALENEQNSKK